MNRLWLLASEATAKPIAQKLAADGVDVWHYPLINVLPSLTPAPKRKNLPAPHRLIFVSANAIAHGLNPVLAALQHLALSPTHPAWPSAWLMGKTFIETLQTHFPQCATPEQGHDSEAVLADPAWQADVLGGQQVWLIKGEGGREVLAPALRARGAQVVEWVVYRRSPAINIAATIAAQWQRAPAEVLTVLSRESLTLLQHAMNAPAHLPDKNALWACPLYVHHWRIERLALEYGFQYVYAAEGLMAMTAKIRSHFGKQSEVE